jgi:hypothetical protein
LCGSETGKDQNGKGRTKTAKTHPEVRHETGCLTFCG